MIQQSYLLAPDFVAHVVLARVPSRSELEVLIEYLVLATRALDPHPHPENFCGRCGRANVVWFTPNHIWNQAVPEGGILCPVCFIRAAEAVGFDTVAWSIEPNVELPAPAAPPPPGEVRTA